MTWHWRVPVQDPLHVLIILALAFEISLNWQLQIHVGIFARFRLDGAAF